MKLNQRQRELLQQEARTFSGSKIEVIDETMMKAEGVEVPVLLVKITSDPVPELNLGRQTTLRIIVGRADSEVPMFSGIVKNQIAAAV